MGRNGVVGALGGVGIMGGNGVMGAYEVMGGNGVVGGIGGHRRIFGVMGGCWGRDTALGQWGDPAMG